MSIGNDEVTLEAKRFHQDQDTCCKWSHFHSALYSYNIALNNEGVLFDITLYKI